MKRILAATAACIALVATATACSEYNDERGKGDAPVINGYGQRKGNDGPRLVTNFPDGFANVATGCVAPGWRAFVTTATSKAGKLVVVADPKCDNYTDGESLYR